MPCAGKTSLCESLKTSGFNNQIRTDEVRGKHFLYPTYSENESNQVFYFLLKELQEMVNKNLDDIIVEGVFATGQRILTIKKIALIKSYEVLCIFLQAPLDTLLVRNSERIETDKFLKPERYGMFLKRYNSSHLSNLTINTDENTKGETTILTKDFLQYGR